METDKRIYGLETEYGVVDLGEDMSHGSETILLFFETIFKKISRLGLADQRNSFYLNGSLIYLEPAGSHPEYASPECAGIKDLITWDKAGERIFEEAMLAANEILIGQGKTERQLRLYKNNLDANREATFGCHENYMVARSIGLDILRRKLVPFLVSRQVLCGSGCVDPTGFHISQRARFIRSEIDVRTTEERPIINMKDEALCSGSDWRRLHLILGDANMNQVSAFLKLGTTALVLRMAEDGFFTDPIEIAEPVLALKQFSADPSCRAAVDCRRPDTGDWIFHMTAIELQEHYLRRAKEYLSQRGGASGMEFGEVVSRWEEALALLKENPMLLYRQIDWIAKKWLMESVLQRHGYDWGNYYESSGGPEIYDFLRTIDLQYHDIRRETGIYYLLEKEGAAETLIGEEAIQQAKTRPPTDTRARWRGEFIRLAQEDERLAKVKCRPTGWDMVTVTYFTERDADGNKVLGDVEQLWHAHDYRHFERGDPFDSQPPETEKIIGILLSS